MSEDTRDPQQIVAELVEKSPICMVTTVGPDGRLLARPMTRQDRAFDGTLHFVAPRDGDMISEIHTTSKVNVSVQSGDGFVSVAGDATEITDRDRLQEMWNPMLGAFFPDGIETATLVEVQAHSAEYWDSNGSSIAHVASFVKSAVTGKGRPDLGTSGTVEL